LIMSALVHAIDAGAKSLTNGFLEWLAIVERLAFIKKENVPISGLSLSFSSATQSSSVPNARLSVAELARSKRERANALNTHQITTLMDRCILRRDDLTTNRTDALSLDHDMSRFADVRASMTPMLAATSRTGHAPEWGAELVRRFYEMGADFKICASGGAMPMHDMIISDPLYQLFKFQIRDVKQKDIEKRRRESRWSVGSTDQRVAEGIIAENLARWRPILDEVLEPDSDKIRDGQVHCVVAALANSARVTVLPVILYLIETAHFDLNQQLMPADAAGGPRQQIGDFFRSNYAALVSLLQKGAKMPYSASEKDPSLRQIAADAQSTHRSNVNLVLKKYISAAKALVERCLQGEALEAAGCLTTELADSACDCPCEMDNPWASKRMSFAERIAAFEKEKEEKKNAGKKPTKSSDVSNSAVDSDLELAYQIADAEQRAYSVRATYMYGSDRRRCLREFCGRECCEGAAARLPSLRVTEDYLLEALNDRLSDADVLRIGLDVPHVRAKFCLDSRKGKENGSFADQQIEAAYEPLEAALEKIRGSLRRSIKRFFSGLTERPVHGALVRTGAKALDLVFKALVCRFVGDQTNRFDIVEDVFVPLFQALLKAQNEYGWERNSCAPGSISFVVAVLEGRLDTPAFSVESSQAAAPAEPGQRALQAGTQSLGDFRRNLLEAFREPTPQDLEAIRAEAVQTCVKEHGVPWERFAEILDVIVVEPESFQYAMNELRGIFFSQLMLKYDHVLEQRFYTTMDRQRRSRSHRPSNAAGYAEPEYISPSMEEALKDLYIIADVFARSFLLVVEDIPRVFQMVKEA